MCSQLLVFDVNDFLFAFVYCLIMYKLLSIMKEMQLKTSKCKNKKIKFIFELTIS